MWAGPSVVKRAYSDMGTKKPPTAWQWAAFGGCFGVRGFEVSSVNKGKNTSVPPAVPPDTIPWGQRGRLISGQWSIQSRSAHGIQQR